MSRVDPRDEQLDPGVLRLDCAEGYSVHVFDDHL